MKFPLRVGLVLLFTTRLKRDIIDFAIERNFIANNQLLPPPRFDLTINHHFAALDQYLRLPTGRHSAKLQELIEPNFQTRFRCGFFVWRVFFSHLADCPFFLGF